MQALKTISEPALFSSVSEPVAALREATAQVCGDRVLYVAGDGYMSSFDISASFSASKLQLSSRGQDFSDPLAVTRGMALLSSGTMLVGWGIAKTSEAVLSMWNVRTAGKHIEKVKDVLVQSPTGGDVITWACFDYEGSTSFTVALAFADIHCSVQLLTFKKGDGRAPKHSVHTVQVAKDSNGDATITNLHLLLPSEPPGAGLRLIVTLTLRSSGGAVRSSIDASGMNESGNSATASGRIESLAADLRKAGQSFSQRDPAEGTTLDATAVTPGLSAHYGRKRSVREKGPLATQETKRRRDALDPDAPEASDADDDENNQVIVFTSARQSGSAPQAYLSQISIYTSDSRKTCLPYQHAVTGAVARADDYTLAAPVRNLRGEDCVAVIDMKNRLELACLPLRAPLRALASMRAARGILMLHHDGSATALLPKPLAAQVAAVTQRKHYRAALGVARDELARLPPDSSEATAARDMIARTSAKYAAHLLERACEPEAAMQQYLQTIGYLSVSTVIQKFLSTEHMPLLKRYMERVAATPSVMRAAYAAVLLSLYVQLRDGEALRRFIDNSIDGDGGYKWNVDDAISTCLNGGYYAEAKQVAQASRRHAAVVDICMHHSSGGVAGLLNANDDGDYAGAGAEAGARPRQDGGREALQYIRSLPRAEREQLLQQHGKALISKFKLEMEVTPVIEELCQPPAAGATHATNISRFVLIYDEAPGALRALCHKLLQEWLAAHAQQAEAPGEAPAAEIPLLFHHLFDLLLDPQLNEGKDGLPEDVRHSQARSVLEQGWPAGTAEPLYDKENVLHLCHYYSFKAGLLFLFQRMNDTTRQLQVLVEYKDWPELARLGMQHPGERGQHLESVLHELVAEVERHPDSDAVSHIRGILDGLPKDPALAEVLTPMAILSTLQRSSTLTLDVAKDFIQQYVRRQQNKAEFHGGKISQLQAETAQLEESVRRKRSEPFVVDTDAVSGGRMGQSAVYFFCGHAFDEDSCARNAGTGTFVCSICQTDPRKQHIRRTTPTQEVDRAKVNEQFFSEIRNPQLSVFDVIGRYLDNHGALI